MSSELSRLTTDNAPANSFVLPEHRVVYMSVTKAACTSLRWMVADLAGEDLGAFTRSTSGVQSSLMTIHGGRGRWKHTPRLSDLDADQLADIRPENGWFIFAAIRDPWTRLWSAWQSKFLVRHNSFVRDYSMEPFFPRVPEKPLDVVEDFHRFVELRPWTTNPLLHKDVHFAPQARSVALDRVPYTRVYDVRQMSTLFTDLHQHLRSVGLDQELYTPRANETPLALTREVMGNGVREAVEEIYAIDFEQFGDRWDFERLKFVDGWTPDAMDHLRYHVVANERISHLSRRARAHEAEERVLRRRLREARERADQLERALEEAKGHDRASRRQLARTKGSTRLRRVGGRVIRALPERVGRRVRQLRR